MRFRLSLTILLASLVFFSCDDALEFSVDESQYETDSANDTVTCTPECSLGQTCIDGKCMTNDDGNCAEDTLGCHGNQPQICKQSHWQNLGTECSSIRPCQNGKCSLAGQVCMVNDVYRCVDDSFTGEGIIYVCQDWTWTRLESCANHLSCLRSSNQLSNENLCGECLNHQYRCDSQSTESINLLECREGKWTDRGRCLASCDETQGCQIAP